MRAIEFPAGPSPRVSILILAWRQPTLLESCLRAIVETCGNTVAYEVIVVLNDATPQVEDFVRSNVRGARLVHSRVNLGFAGGNNRAASEARGEYLVLLNDDTSVEPGWLDWLVATADANPRAGAVGSTILFADGRIQEAGSILWNDGSTMPIGRGEAGESLEWQFVRRVDYSSACSLLVRRSVWEDVGGFDEEYFPAYYEDVDLCLGIRQLGLDILYEPRSRVRHHESASSEVSFKRFLFARNKRRLVEKWRPVLDFQEPAAPSSPPAITRAVWRARGCPRRILVVDDRSPDRSMGAGFGRMFDALVELSDAGFVLTLFPTAKVDPLHDGLVWKGVALLAGSLDEHLRRPDIFYDAVIVSRPHNFSRVSALVRRNQPQAALVYDAEALYWRRLERQASITLAIDEVEARRLTVAARFSRRLEERIFRESDYAVAVSRDEAEILHGLQGACPVDVLLPSEPNVPFTSRSFADRRDLGYVAGWLAGPQSPNADGLRWFVADVLPHLCTLVPWVTLKVTGANPPTEMLALGGPNVEFTGRVESLPRFYDGIRVAIAPIRYGAGVKLKTVEALQYGVPVVATTVGAEGIQVAGIDAIDIEDDPRRYAERIAALLTDPKAWERKRTAIAQLVKPWSTPQDSETWTGALDKALSRKRSGKQPILVRR
jgi:O-antigen biosynthesis protein